ncbi:MAG: 30S ribosomal protein S3 [Spirochaetes bacterium GWB1_48_6]|uniref:30S ribosomal protein S3 n=1 Tax=uncultured organism TaxID=155900 RepID=U3GU54_9ZZZZ|nr:30S ribosomal protein S3 [uncultured organism]OHD13408.1 MAG: 30S ribosomal protein S3 [Spirochaetes bacterium GWB1_48_6]
MGQKVHPIGLRLNINKTWSSRWYVGPRDYAKTLHEDLKLRKFIYDIPEIKGADVSAVDIVRQPQRVTIIISTARPGVIIGTKGANIEKIGDQVQKLIDKKVAIKIKEIKKPEVDAQIIALNVARQLKARGSFRKALKQSITNAMKNGAQGVKIKISGRLGGAEMSREMEMKEGRVPLHTLRADIDYGFAESFTTFGAIGVKVWLFNGLVFKRDNKDDAGSIVKKSVDKA